MDIMLLFLTAKELFHWKRNVIATLIATLIYSESEIKKLHQKHCYIKFNFGFLIEHLEYNYCNNTPQITHCK